MSLRLFKNVKFQTFSRKKNLEWDKIEYASQGVEIIVKTKVIYEITEG